MTKQKFSEGEFEVQVNPDPNGIPFMITAEYSESYFLAEVNAIEDAQLFAASKKLLKNNIELINILEDLQAINGFPLKICNKIKNARKIIYEVLGEEEFQDWMLEVEVK